MATAAQTLAKFAADLKYEDIPPAVIERAKDCIINTIAVTTFGSQLPWGRIAVDYARRYGSGGPCSLIGVQDVRVHAPFAALANGLCAHAFEQDSAFDPGKGAHPGASVLPALLAACQESNAGGKAAITAFVAGCEVLYRVGDASHHSETGPESLGFHAPGLTGSFGAAMGAGRIYGLNEERLAHALGIAGSLSSGILAFTKSQHGGMVKRLHIGRSAESGILAARLAGDGYTGPETVFEGKFGFLEAYARGADVPRLTAGLGKTWGTLTLSIKRYPFHMSGHTAVQSLRDLMAEHGFKGPDVEKIVVEGIPKIVSHNYITEPGDVMQAQYSVPFCVAFALFRDPDDPNQFIGGALEDPAIRAACRNIEVRALPDGGRSAKHTRITVRLKNGQEFTRENETFKGTPASPLDRQELRRKFLLQAAAMGERAASALFDRLASLETQPRFPYP